MFLMSVYKLAKLAAHCSFEFSALIFLCPFQFVHYYRWMLALRGINICECIIIMYS